MIQLNVIQDPISGGGGNGATLLSQATQSLVFNGNKDSVPVPSNSNPVPITGAGSPPVFTNSGVAGSTELIAPYKDPNGSKRAEIIDMMFDISPPISDMNIVYNTGIPNSESIRSFNIFNKTLATNLQFVFDIPEIFIISPSSEFVVPPNSHVIMTLTVNENILFNLPVGGNSFSINLNVIPLNVSGPVYIHKITPIIVF